MTEIADARWTFTDSAVPETWSHPINPNEMSSPYQTREAEHSAGRHNTVAVFIGAPKNPKEWTFGGVIRTQAHHDELERWARKKKIITITTHQSEIFEVIITSFDPEDRHPTPNVPWRLKYKMQCLILRRVA